MVVSIDDVVDQKLEALHQHKSQFYEWLPWNENILDSVPDNEDERKEWLRENWLDRSREVADRFRDALIDRYGDAGHDITYAEAFEGCEYGSPLTDDNAPELFPE